MPENSEVLRVHNLRTTFDTPRGPLHAVDGVSLSVQEGETLGLVGESGCGKSVTAHSILRLIDPPGRIDQTSRVLWRGDDLLRASESTLRKVRGSAIAMIFQEPMTSLNPLYPIGAQIAEVVRLHTGVSRAAASRRAVELLGHVGIPAAAERSKDYPHQLSGGMCQRVMIAMALSCDPQLLIADEPTTALDVTIQAQILDLIRRLAAERRMAVILITHDFGVVAEMATNVAVMYAGRIVEYGSAREIFRHPAHPYTQALLESVPRLGIDRSARLPSIPGSIFVPLGTRTGCSFSDRCVHAFDRCRVEDPALMGTPEHPSACWLFHDGGKTSDALLDASSATG